MAIMLNDCSHPYIEKGQSERTIKARIVSNNLSLDSIKCSVRALDLLKKLLHPNPHERIKACDALSHPWLQPNKRQFITTDGKKKTLTASSFYQPVQTSKLSRSTVSQALKLLLLLAFQRRRASPQPHNASWKEKLRSLSKTTSVKLEAPEARSPSKHTSQYHTNHTASSFYPPFIHRASKALGATKNALAEKLRIDPELVQYGANNISEQLVHSVDSRDSATNNMFFVRKGHSLSEQRDVHHNRFRVVSRGALNPADSRALEAGRPRKTADKKTPFRQASLAHEQQKKPAAGRELLLSHADGPHSSDNRRTQDSLRRELHPRTRDLSKTLNGAFLDPYTAQARGASHELSLERRRRELQLVAAFKTPKRELRHNTLIGHLKSNYEQVKASG